MELSTVFQILMVMNEAMIERLFSHRQINTLSTISSSRQNLTFEQLHIYYSEHRLALNEKFADNLDLRNSYGEYNFLAYLLADSNGASLKVAKYDGTDKIDLIENEEYGYRCLITAIYRVLDKLDVENKTFAKITSRNRLERKLINAVALREAFINAVVHNDYSLGWPVVEFFTDRVTITSTGGLVEGLSQEDFFNGRSMLRNRELMRVFKDVELVEGLGSGMRRILAAYDRSVFEITPSFIIATFPYATDFERSVSEDGLKNERSLSEDMSEAVLQKLMPILDYLDTHENITPLDARRLTGKSAAAVRRYLALLCDQGVLEPTGNTSKKSYRRKMPSK
jgi:predicted HTH transcriptional regulator